MRTAREIQDNIAELQDELDAIVAVADKEERDLSEEETLRVTEIADNQVPTLKRNLKTVTKIEREKNARGFKRMEEEIDANIEAAGASGDSSSVTSIGRFSGIKIPAKARVHSELTSFIGPDAEKNAYITGNVILAGVYGTESAIAFCRNNRIQVNNTLVTNDNSKGGFLVPDEMQREVIRLREARGVFPKYANRVPMGSDIIRIPRLLSDVTAYWVGEAQEITPSDLVLGDLELMAKKLAVLTKISSELDEDSVIDIANLVTESMAYQMADKIDQAAFNGDGTSTYGGTLGLANALDANAIYTAASTHTGAGTLTLADFEGVVGMYPQYGGASPRWYMSGPVYFSSAIRLMDAAGGNTMVNYSDGASQAMFLGYPVTFVQVMPQTTTALASTIIAYFGDLRLGAAYGTRRAQRIETTTERYFEFDLIGIKTTERIAINIHERGDTIRTRPIIALKTAAS